MSRGYWNLMLLADRAGSIRQLRVSWRTLKLAAAGAILLPPLFLGIVLAIGYQAKAQHDVHRLESENAVLLGELQAARDRVKELSGDLAGMLDEGARLRLAAGLDRLHHEVLEVGVGGPGSRAPDEHPLWHTNPNVGEVAFTVGYDLSVLERRARLHRESLSEAGDSIHAHRERLFATPSIVPTHGRVSSSFSRSRNHPIHNRPMPHTGVDISAPRGTPILATARGRVTRAGWRAGYGLSVELDHGHTYSTLYAHASEVLVKVGDEVERGDVIARVGNTGTATAPHLHYEVLVNGRPQNPMGFVIPFGAP